ncbi:MAG: TolC family protein [Sandaracinaceae bacterium]|nr:TolC family protein [Sandaracinaceae bacterium]
MWTALSSVPCSAQAPLEVFLEAGRARALDLREAELNRELARSQIDEARARWLPSFTASGGYTRNEVDVVVTIPTGATTSTQATITPLDQADLTLQANVPLVDVGAWLTFSASEATADAAGHRARAAEGETDLAVATAYHQVVATRALRDAAVRAREAAEANLARARARQEAQLASELEVARAEAEVARTDQQIADAELQVSLAERNLEVLTGLAPGPERVTLREDALEEPEALDLALVHELAELRASDEDVEAARRARDASWAALAPTISAFARERITNASGFGPSAIWAVGVQASFTLDFLRPAQIGTRERQLELAELRRERTSEAARTRAIEARARLVSAVARARATRAQERSARRARDVAVSRLESQLGTQLDVLTAERDLVQAEGSRIQSEGDLAVARLAYLVRTTGSIAGGAR